MSGGDDHESVAQKLAPALTGSERKEIIALAKAKARNAVDKVKAAGAVREVELLRQLDAQFAVEDEKIKDIAAEIEQMAVQANAIVAKRCADAGIMTAVVPQIEVFDLRFQSYGVMEPDARKRLREQVKAENAAEVAKAIAETDAWVLTVTEDLLTAGLTGEGARAYIEAMPSTVDLLPPADPQTVLSGKGAKPEALLALESQSLISSEDAEEIESAEDVEEVGP